MNLCETSNNVRVITVMVMDTNAQKTPHTYYHRQYDIDTYTADLDSELHYGFKSWSQATTGRVC